MAATKPSALAPGATYEFSRPPQSVPATRAPYRQDDPASMTAGNLMYDRRVVRGNTYAAQILTPSQQAEAEAAQKNREAQRKQKELDESRRIAEGKRVRTPDPVVGRSHGGTQTDSYLETLSDKVPEADGTTQTDAFMDRPPTPMFVPAKIGLDKATQIAAGDLFDFDREVEPILEVLVGKTLEQSLMEVHEDIELENIRARQREFEQIRNVELAEVQRLEAEVRRKEAEKRRRVQQERERLAQEAETKRKVAAASFARQHLTGLVSNVFDTLVADGHFFDPLTREVEEKFLPGVYDRVTASLSKVALSNALADDVIAAALSLAEKKRTAEVERVRKEREAEAKRLAEEAEAKRRAEEEAREKARLAAEAEAKAAEDGGDAADE